MGDTFGLIIAFLYFLTMMGGICCGLALAEGRRPRPFTGLLVVVTSIAVPMGIAAACTFLGFRF